MKNAPTTEELRLMLESESASTLEEALSVAEERDALAAEVARLREALKEMRESAAALGENTTIEPDEVNCTLVGLASAIRDLPLPG